MEEEEDGDGMRNHEGPSESVILIYWNSHGVPSRYLNISEEVPPTGAKRWSGHGCHNLPTLKLFDH